MWFISIIWQFILDFIETIVVSAAIFVIVYLFLFQPHQVDGRSMEPNFYNAEYILTDKLSYRFTAPKRGDVVVFHSPQNEEVDFIKRIIGVPGDTLSLKGGYLYLNGTKLEESYINDPGAVSQGKFLKENGSVEVPPGQYAVMGDNRLHSSDSREWGFVNASSIVGRAFFRYWPPQAFGIISEHATELAL